jgi:hypothetical protein
MKHIIVLFVPPPAVMRPNDVVQRFLLTGKIPPFIENPHKMPKVHNF